MYTHTYLLAFMYVLDFAVVALVAIYGKRPYFDHYIHCCARCSNGHTTNQPMSGWLVSNRLWLSLLFIIHFWLACHVFFLPFEEALKLVHATLRKYREIFEAENCLKCPQQMEARDFGGQDSWMFCLFRMYRFSAGNVWLFFVWKTIFLLWRSISFLSFWSWFAKSAVAISFWSRNDNLIILQLAVNDEQFLCVVHNDWTSNVFSPFRFVTRRLEAEPGTTLIKALGKA